MIYRIKYRKVFTHSSDTAISLLHKGYKLQSVSYAINGRGHQNYTLVK